MKDKRVKFLVLGIAFAIAVGTIFECRSKRPEPVTVTIPESKGTTEEIVLEQIEVEPIKLLVITKDSTIKTKEVVVDKKYKEMYEQAKDSLERMQLYLEAITIRQYDKVFIDNDDIRIDGTIRTRGSLVGYNFNYLIKESQITYTPEVITQLPRLSVGLGIEVGIPLGFTNNFSLRGNLMINRGSTGYMIGYETDQTIWLGINKTFKLY